MPCLLLIIALVAPRLMVFALWLIGWFNIFPSIMWPILGFIFLPTTLIWYTAVGHWYDGVWTAWRFVVLIFALAIDVSPARGRSNGRSALRRTRQETFPGVRDVLERTSCLNVLVSGFSRTLISVFVG